MKAPLGYIFLIAVLFACATCFAQETTFKLKGVVKDRDNKALKLVRVTEDPEFSAGIVVPIVDNKFEQKITVPHIEEYFIVFEQEGPYRVLTFFPDSSTVEFELYSEKDYDKNIIRGGKLNKEKFDFRKFRATEFRSLLSRIDSLKRKNSYYTEAYQKVLDKLQHTWKDQERTLVKMERDLLRAKNEAYTAEASAIHQKLEEAHQESRELQYKYVKENRDILAYSLLLHQARGINEDNMHFIAATFPSFSEKYPSHPYTKQIRDLLNGAKAIQVGGHYVDFSASTIDGKEVRLSDEIKGKVALIDLWASWCGPCRRKSISMIPVYEKYKNKGFTIVGVANETNDTDALKKALQQDEYPWLNLVELNNKNGIWNKYNIVNQAGSTFLVDSTGKILAINPSDQEVDKILSGLLN